MKLALINPKSTRTGTEKEIARDEDFEKEFSYIDHLQEIKSCPNSGLIKVFALASDFFDEIDYIDGDFEEIPYDKNYDMVALSFMTQQATNAIKIAQTFRQKTDSYLIGGGIHVTSTPEESQNYFDTIFIGEAEKTWYEFMKDFKENNPKRIYINNDNNINLDNFPIPRYDLLFKNKRYRTIPLQIGRGCPHDCEFCTVTKYYGSKYRHKSIPRVLEEIEAIKKYNPNTNIYFTDENLKFHTPFIRDLLDALTGCKINWFGFTDVEVAYNEETLKKLIPAGCRRLSIGFESIESESLKFIENWKYNHLKNYPDIINRIQSHGIGLWGTFIVGHDNDDKDCFQRLIDFVLENRIYAALISILTPFPGSRTYERFEKDGRILTKHWGSYTIRNSVFKPAKMSPQELEAGYDLIAKHIYSKEAAREKMEHFKKIYEDLYKEKQKII